MADRNAAIETNGMEPPKDPKKDALYKNPLVTGMDLNLFLYFSVQYMLIPLQYVHIYDVVSKEYNHTMTLESVHKCEAKMRNETDIRLQIAEETSRVLFKMNLPRIVPQIIVVPLIGIMSDITGNRKFTLWWPCVGNLIYIICFMIDVYAHVGLWILYVGYGFLGVFGGGEAFYTGAAAMVSDKYPMCKRSFRLAILESAMVLAVSVADFSIDLTLKSVDDVFIPCLWCTLLIAIITMTVCIFFTDDTCKMTRRPNLDNFIEGCKNAAKLCRVKGDRAKVIHLCFWSFALYTFLLVGQREITNIDFEEPPLCFDGELAGVWVLCHGIVMILGNFVATKIMTKFSQDIGWTAQGYITTALAYVWLAFGRLGLLTYGALSILLFQALPNITLRSIASKRVSPKTQATLYGIFHMSQVLLGYLSVIAYDALYAYTREAQQVAFYYFALCLLLIPSVLLIFLALVMGGSNDAFVYSDEIVTQPSRPSRRKQVKQSSYDSAREML